VSRGLEVLVIKSCSEVYEFAAYPGQCNGKLWSVVIGTGGYGRRLRTESTSKRRICRKSEVFR
jgi:hypothetical protein